MTDDNIDYDPKTMIARPALLPMLGITTSTLGTLTRTGGFPSPLGRTFGGALLYDRRAVLEHLATRAEASITSRGRPVSWGDAVAIELNNLNSTRVDMQSHEQGRDELRMGG